MPVSRRHLLAAPVLALGASGSLEDVLEIDTRRQAEALAPPPTVRAIRTHGHASYGDDGGAVWSRASGDPGHQGWFRTADGSVWVLAEAILRPEMFGTIGASPEDDTAAWQSLATVARARAASGRVLIEATGTYLIASPISFRNGGRCRLTLRGARFFQTRRLAPILHFHTCDEVWIEGGDFTGLGGEAGEFEGAASSHNGVAAAYFEHVEVVRVRGSQTRDFAGGAFFVLGGRVRDFEGVTCRGIGARHIDPERPVSNQANGGDAALHFVPGSPFPGWIYEDRIVNCSLADHAFGVRNVATRTFILQNNEIGPCPGQHGVYGTDLDGVVATDNVIRDCRQAGFKNQLENYAGRFVGEQWEAGADYLPGMLVRHQELLLECLSRHQAGTTLEAVRWRPASRLRRDKGIFSRNRIARCGTGFHQLATAHVQGKPIWSSGWSLSENVFADCTESAIRCERMLSATVVGNRINNAGFAALFLTGFAGRIAQNQIRGSQVSALLICAVGDVEIVGNRLADAGVSGRDPAQEAVATFFPPDAETMIPGSPVRPMVTFTDNEFSWSLREAPRYALFGYDPRLRLKADGSEIIGPVRPAIRWDGPVSDVGNDFSGVITDRVSEAG